MILSNVKYVNVEKTSCHANTPDGWDHYFPAVEGNNFWDEVVLQEITPADYTDPPATMQGIRNLRNQLLKDTDWQASSDRTMSAGEANYRTLLRDLPATNSDPTKIVFPDAP